MVEVSSLTEHNIGRLTESIIDKVNPKFSALQTQDADTVDMLTEKDMKGTLMSSIGSQWDPEKMKSRVSSNDRQIKKRQEGGFCDSCTIF